MHWAFGYRSVRVYYLTSETHLGHRLGSALLVLGRACRLLGGQLATSCTGAHLTRVCQCGGNVGVAAPPHELGFALGLARRKLLTTGAKTAATTTGKER